VGATRLICADLAAGSSHSPGFDCPRDSNHRIALQTRSRVTLFFWRNPSFGLFFAFEKEYLDDPTDSLRNEESFGLSGKQEFQGNVSSGHQMAGNSLKGAIQPVRGSLANWQPEHKSAGDIWCWCGPPAPRVDTSGLIRQRRFGCFSLFSGIIVLKGLVICEYATPKAKYCCQAVAALRRP
jgi:hypothetical protein